MRAAISRFGPNGSRHEIYTNGVRNAVGMRWYPGTETLWVTMQERDGLGDDLVPDYLTRIQAGAFTAGLTPMSVPTQTLAVKTLPRG